ncbi:MAG: Holliday junction branch migration protein RuvA [Candidatus Pacebacteria bacterium]|nr:Holliday junction branch migration protein RuvA [Candidatus Paceibacterota bacterium]
MISYLTGKPLFEIDAALTLDVRGTGYQIFVTEQTLTWSLMQSEVSLFIHSIIRENAFDLYGFETKNELYFFKKLLGVSGIGPRSALAMIGLASTDTLYQAIVHDNLDFLTSVPGIGKKTAERMCVELRDKLKDYAGETEKVIHDGDTDVIDALVALGYSPAKAYAALNEVDETITATNERIKAALNNIN